MVCSALKTILAQSSPYDYFVFVDEPDLEFYYIAPETFARGKLYLTNIKGVLVEIKLTDDDKFAIGEEAGDILSQCLDLTF